MSVTNMDPLFAAEATVDLFPALGDGSPDTGNPLWLGFRIEGMRLGGMFEKFKVAATGALYPMERVVGESHTLSFDRVWMTKAGQADVSFARDTDYVLRIAWRSERRPELTVTRTYFQVRPSERSLSSEGIYEYQDNQTFTAQRFATS